MKHKWFVVVIAFLIAVLFPVGSLYATPPSMPAITLPVDIASIVTAVVAVGAAICLAVWGPHIGFMFARKVKNGMARSVRT